jgi:coenzyme F420-0:L-glutamate ligase/coenzyme F420-1:gamma-L-glutamate ligase
MKKKVFESTNHLEIIGIDNLPEIKKGDDLTALFLSALEEKELELEDGDAIVITSKISSKSEGRVVVLI